MQIFIFKIAKSKIIADKNLNFKRKKFIKEVYS